MRDRLKELATDLLIKHGYRGVSFGDLSQALKTTRANIHYHFGNKDKLVEEVLEDYVRATVVELNELLTNPDVTFAAKLRATIEHNRRRYMKFNSRGHMGNSWGLISRMRQDSDALTPAARATLKRFGKDLFASVTAAIDISKTRGEFAASLPTEDIALQLVSIANSAGSITQDSGNFARLEQLYLAFERLVVRAYGTPGAQAAIARTRPKARAA